MTPAERLTDEYNYWLGRWAEAREVEDWDLMAYVEDRLQSLEMEMGEVEA